jgi:predicted RNase H-like HicB family nuclease
VLEEPGVNRFRLKQCEGLEDPGFVIRPDRADLDGGAVLQRFGGFEVHGIHGGRIAANGSTDVAPASNHAGTEIKSHCCPPLRWGSLWLDEKPLRMAVVRPLAGRLHQDALKVCFDEWVLPVAVSRQIAAFSARGLAQEETGIAASLELSHRTSMQYRIRLIQSDEGWAVSCPSLPGCHSQGDTREEAVENIKSAIQEWLQVEAEESGVSKVEEDLVVV